MGETDARLRNLLADESGSCCESDVEGRLADLRDLVAAVPEDSHRDRRALRALGDDTRYTLLRVLVAGGERCVCELTPLVDVSDSAVSHALSDLVEAGLAARRKEGTWRYYGPTERAEALVAALDETRGGVE